MTAPPPRPNPFTLPQKIRKILQSPLPGWFLTPVPLCCWKAFGWSFKTAWDVLSLLPPANARPHVSFHLLRESSLQNARRVSPPSTPPSCRAFKNSWSPPASSEFQLEYRFLTNFFPFLFARGCSRPWLRTSSLESLVLFYDAGCQRVPRPFIYQ